MAQIVDRMKDVTMRLANYEDLLEIRDIREEVDEFLAGPFLVNDIGQEQWARSISTRDDIYVFAVVNDYNNIIGYSLLNFINYIQRRCYGQVQIKEANRDKGIGTTAWRELLDIAFNDLGMNKVLLEVLVDNERAIHVYEKVGFSIEGTLREYYYKNGAFRDVYIMSVLRSEYMNQYTVSDISLDCNGTADFSYRDYTTIYTEGTDQGRL